MTLNMAIVHRLRTLCFHRRVKGVELSRRTGISVSTIYKIMDGRLNALSVDTLKKLCDALDISLVDFFGAGIFNEIDDRQPDKTV